MKLTKLLITGIVLLSGCTTGDHLYSSNGQCITCFNNPLTGEGLNYEATESKQANVRQASSTVTEQNQESTSDKYCHNRIKYKKDIPIDVDVAYVRYKKTFGFLTKNERIRASGHDPATVNPIFTVMDSGFRHEVTPGVSYQMQDAINLNGQNHAGWLMVELEKSGIEKTRVIVNHCEGGEDGFNPKYTQVIREKIETGYL